MQNIGSDVARGQNRIRNIFPQRRKDRRDKSNSELGVLSALSGEMSGSETVSNSQKIGVSRENF
jgi:hypothetical protein